MTTRKAQGRFRIHASFTLMTLIVLLLGLSVSQASAANFPDEDGPLRNRATLTGKYGMIAGGAGLEDTGINTLALNVPGSSIAAAYLYWAGTTNDDAGDNTVNFQVDGGTAQSLTADDVYGPSLWYYSFGTGDTYYHHVYVRDVTALAQLGAHTYTLSGYTVSGGSGLAYGFGMVVVYEDQTLNDSTITLLDGLDSVYWQFDPPRDSPSSVNCVNFEANPTLPRVMEFYVFAGGSADSNEEDRPNSLHYVVGSGAPPTDVLNAPGQVTVTDPFVSTSGNAWDTYTETIVIPAGATYACFQTSSDGGPFGNPDGASFLWLMGGFNLKEETPTAVSLATFSADNRLVLPVASVALALTLLGSLTGVLVVRRRRA